MFSRLLLFITLVSFTSNDNETADSVLQKILELEEVESYFSRMPRFNSSVENKIMLIKNEEIDLSQQHTVNKTPLVVTDKEEVTNNNLVAYLELKEYIHDDNKVSIKLNLQNAVLFYEENKLITIEAQLVRSRNEWRIKNYKLREVKISD